MTPSVASSALPVSSPRRPSDDILVVAPPIFPARRDLLRGGGAIAAGLVLGSHARAATTTTIDVTMLGADPGGNNDSTPAFNMALTMLASPGGGTIYVPAGHYLMNAQFNVGTAASPINFPVTIRGEGSGQSQFVFNHPNIGISMVSNWPKMSVLDLGFTSLANTDCGISITMPPAQVSGYQTCVVENLDFGVQVPGGTGLIGCLALTNIWKSMIRNVTTNGVVVPGSYLVMLGGRSIDNWFVDCQASGVDTAFIVNSYCEGVRLVSPMIAGCNTALTTGTAAFRQGTPQNVLGLYISEGEISCFNSALNLYQVWTGWISNTHFGSSNNDGDTPRTTVQLNGCFDVQMSECQVTGAYNQVGPAQNCVGITMAGVPTAGCAQNQVDDCVFTNLGLSLAYGAGSSWNNATRIKQINGPTFPSLAQTGVVTDVTLPGSSNQADWDTGLPGGARFKYLR